MRLLIVALLILGGLCGGVAHASDISVSDLKVKIHHLRADRNYWEDCYRQNRPNC